MAVKSPAAAMKLGPLSLLQRVHWRRVILDEAHFIKNKRCTTAKAAFALTAERRWCLSGTPLQNRVGEMFSLVRYLRVRPYALYFCKNCPCSSFEYKFDENGRSCSLCGHSPLRHYNWLNRYVLNPIKQYGYIGPGRDAMLTLRKEVLDGMLLRRTKEGRAADLSLPTRLITLRNDLELDAFEDDFYTALWTQSQARFGAYAAAGTVLNNYAHIFDLLTRLRQAVDHPYLILYGSGSGGGGEGVEFGEAAGAGAGWLGRDVCGICRESVEDAVVTGCRHVFCRLCMREYLESLGGRARSMLRDVTREEVEAERHDIVDGGAQEDGSGQGRKKRRSGPVVPITPIATTATNDDPLGGPISPDRVTPTCPTCFAPLTVDLTSVAPEPVVAGEGAIASPVPLAKPRGGILSRIPADRVGRAFRSSTKIEALLEDLWRAQMEEPGTKAIVFSQFVNMLDLIQHRLSHAGVRCVKMDGSMTVPARDRVISAFRDDPHVTVFLISLKAGGVALNLTAANRLYLMDPWWNPAAEFQALDRTHRLGQHRTITAVRFIVRGTVEERIIALQEKKRLVFEGTVGQDSGALSRLTEEDMRFLFSG